jgi:polygalacturonase
MHGGSMIPQEFGESAIPECLAEGQGFVSVKDFGANGVGSTIDTNAINTAVETVSKSGGGTIRLPAGTYMSFPVHLQSSVVLYLEQGATLDIQAYCDT